MCLFGFSWDSSETHLVAGNMFSGVKKIHPQMLVAPGDSRSFHGFTIGEESLSRFAAYDPSEGRSSSTLTVTLNRLFLTSRPWQVAQSSSKIPLPILGSPAGTTTSGSLIPFLALGGISNKIIVGESNFCLIKFHQISNQSKSNPP